MSLIKSPPPDTVSQPAGGDRSFPRAEDLAQLTDLVADYSGGLAVWDLPISDKVANPVVRRAQPQGTFRTERPVDISELL